MFKEISDVIDNHLFEALDEMKINVAKDLNISEDQVKFIEYPNRTDICVTKEGKQVCVCVKVAGDQDVLA